MSEVRRGRRQRQSGQSKCNENDFGKNIVILANKQPRAKPKDEDYQVEERGLEKSGPFLLKNSRIVQKSIPAQTKSAISKVIHDNVRNGSEERSEPPRTSTARAAEKHEMVQRAKFLNKYGELEEDLLQFLSEESSFKVIGIMGLQGSGKSTILNTIIGKTVFPVEKLDDIENSRHRTVGVDAFVTTDRTILLDMQPIMSLSLMDGLLQNENRTQSANVGYHQSLENQIMIDSLQTACFLLSICHTVLVAFDYSLDRDLVQFLQSAEMLKPTTPKTTTTNVLDDEISDYFPHVVFVRNKCDFVGTKDREIMSSDISRVFKDSLLLHNDGVTNSSPRSPASDEAVNIFQIPMKDGVCYESICDEFLAKMMGMPQEDFVEIQSGVFTERNWFQYSARIWDGIKKSSMFQEYKRLLV